MKNRIWPRSKWCACMLAFLVVIPATALPAPLTLNVLDPDRVSAPGAIEMFSGTVTNGTGADLLASELFFNFFNIFDPGVLSLTQLLGIPDFAIPNGATTGAIDLFEAALGSNAQAGGFYFADVNLESVNADVSDVVTVTFRIPEPSTAALLLPLLLGLGWRVSAQWRGRGAPARLRGEGARGEPL